MTSITAFDAAQRALRAFAFAQPVLQSKSPQRSEDAASPQQSPVTCPGQCTAEQESEGGCLLQCLYMADRCDRNCAGCSVTAHATGGERRACAAPSLVGIDGRQSAGCPDGNHGDRKISEGGTGL